MKKITVIASFITTLMLFGCAKPTTEVKSGASVLNIPEQHHNTKQNQKDNVDQILADVAQIQQVGEHQQQAAIDLQQRMEQAMQKQNLADMAKLATEFKTFIENSNQRLKTLKLQTEEGQNLRDAVIHNSTIGLEVSQVLLTKPQKDIDPTVMQSLQEKAMQAQSELMMITEVIRNKVQTTQPNMLPHGQGDMSSHTHEEALATQQHEPVPLQHQEDAAQ